MRAPQAALAAFLALQCALEHPVMCQQTSTSNVASASPPPAVYKRCPKKVRRTQLKTVINLIGIRRQTRKTITTTYILTMETCPPAKQQCCGKSSGCCESNDIWPYLYVLFALLGVALVAVAVGGTYYWYKRKRARRAEIQPSIPSGPPTQPGYYPAPSLPQQSAYPPPPPPPGFTVPPMSGYAPPPAMGYPSPPPAVPSPPPSPGYPPSAPTGYGSPPLPPANPPPSGPVNVYPTVP